MNKIQILKYTIAVFSIIVSVLFFVGGNEILRLKNENQQLKKQVRYLELSMEYKPILEKIEQVRNNAR